MLKRLVRFITQSTTSALPGETRKGLPLVAVINNGKTKVYASENPASITPHEVTFRDGGRVHARGRGQSSSNFKTVRFFVRGDGMEQGNV